MNFDDIPSSSVAGETENQSILKLLIGSDSGFDISVSLSCG